MRKPILRHLDPKTSKRIRGLALACACGTLLLAGCSQTEFRDLQQYVNDVKSRPAGRIPPLPDFETYESFVYADMELRDPFLPKEEATVVRADGKSDKNAPDQNRHKEALENFPLDGLEFVGLMENKSQTWALVKAPDNIIYRAKVGNYLGQNYGRITSVAESMIELVETVPDGLGGWIKRDAAIALKE